MTLNKRGFTLIELIVVIAIIAILAAVAIPNLMTITRRSQEGADIANVKILNDATAAYCSMHSIAPDQAFDGLSTDAARMQALISDGLLIAIPSPQENGVSFAWSADSAAWAVVGAG